MEIATIKGETRQPGGRNANQRLRRRGFVPAVIYGHHQPPENVALSLHDTVLALQQLAHVVKLDVDGREQQYLLKDVQYDHLQQDPIHVDLMRVDPNERVRVKVSIELRGTPVGTSQGGTLVHILTDLEVECLLLKIPQSLRIKVDHLALNEALHVRDLELPADVKVLHSPDEIVAVVHPPRGTTTAEIAAAEEGSETSAEPEVIGKGKQEKEAGAGEE